MDLQSAEIKDGRKVGIFFASRPWLWRARNTRTTRRLTAGVVGRSFVDRNTVRPQRYRALLPALVCYIEKSERELLARICSFGLESRCQRTV
jgi:hypothetical protein